MTQPPGPFGGAYGQPGPYGPPPQPPQKKNLLPWLIVGGAVLLSGLGILLVVLLRGDDTSDPRNDASNSTPAASSSSSRASESAHADLPGGAQVAEQSSGADQSRYAGSGDVALAWVEAMAQGEFQTAYDLSCAEVQTAAAEATPGEDPAWALGTYFFEQTLGGQGFTDGSFDSIIYSEASDSDVASFTLQLDNGEEFLLLVYVQPDGTVCDFI
ncbi:MAG: hypothetical protein JWP62_1522 [Blastococcus sp.]|jgi:hypothetical protein|nr:hypothetical protein [Blastococcus sp.]